MESKVVAPAQGKKTALQNGKLNAPENPITPYIKGNGVGADVTPAMLKVVDTATEKAYKDRRKVFRMEIYTSEKSTRVYGQDVWLSAETLDLIREYRVAIKNPLTTPVGGSIRSLNVALRQELDLYICLRPVRYYQGTPNPVKHPELTDTAIFRENSEDIYASVEQKADSADTKKMIKFLREETGVEKIRLPEHCGIGIRSCSEEDTRHPVRVVIEYAIANDHDSVALMRKGNIMKFIEGAFKDWGYQLAHGEFGGKPIDGGPQPRVKNPNTSKEIVTKDMIADVFLQQILLRPAEYDVIICMSLNGDYISDVLVVQVDGIGIAPGVNIGDECALLGATHDTAPKYIGQDKVNLGSIIPSAEMMLHHVGWIEATGLIIRGTEGTINAKTVTYDLERLIEGAKLLECLEFSDAIIKNM